VKIITKKPIVANQQEVRENPASRSARLRCAVKLGQDSSSVEAMKVTA
jgi:16S rRNA C1402 N4-methylase RsmH